MDLRLTPISELLYKSSRQQVKNELNPQLKPITTMPTTHSIVKSDDDHKSQIIDSDYPLQENLEILRDYEKKRLKSIEILTEDEMINIDQWLLILYNT